MPVGVGAGIAVGTAVFIVPVALWDVVDRVLKLVTLDAELVKLPAVVVDVKVGELEDELEKPATVVEEVVGDVLLGLLGNMLEAIVVPDVVEVRKPVTLPIEELPVAANRLLVVVDGLSVLTKEI
jgi:hypothetical protein